MAELTPIPALRRWSPRHLKTRIILVVLALCLAGLAAITLMIDRAQQHSLQEVLQGQQLSTIRYVAQDIDGKLQTRLRGLEVVANNLPPGLLRNSHELEKWLTDRRAIYALFNFGLIVVKPDGNGAFADYPPLPGRRTNPYADRDWFQAVQAKGALTIGQPTLGRAAKAPVLIMAAPVRDEQGKIAAVLAGVTTLDAPGFLDLLFEFKLGNSGDFLLIAPQHRIFVAATDRSLWLKPVPQPGRNLMHDRYMAGFEGSGIAVNSRGSEELTSAARIPTTGWFVVGRLPLREAFAPIHHTRRELLQTAALVILPLALLLWLALRRQLQPLTRAARQLLGMGRGEQPFRPLPIERSDEIGQLLEGFNLLQHRLEEHEKALFANARALNASQTMLNEAQLIAHMGSWRYQPDSGQLQVSDGLRRLWGLSELCTSITVDQLLAAIPADDRPRLSALLQPEAAHANFGRREFDLRLQPPDRPLRLLRVVVEVSSDDFDHRVIGGIALDITERRREEQLLQLAMQTFHTLGQTVLWITRQGEIAYANAAACRALGYSEAELRHLTIGDIDPNFPTATWQEQQALWHPSATPGSQCLESLHRHRDGRLTPVEITVTAIVSANDAYLALLCQDISERKAHEEQMRHAAQHDPLTGLANRALFQERLEQAIASADRKTTRLAVMFIDLDRFKPINDQHGHEVGDQLLQQVAHRLNDCVRRADTVARLGGDEFVILLADTGPREGVIRVTQKCLDALSANFQVGPLSLSIGASIGIALYPEHGDQPDLLLAHADAAMYEAKRRGRHRHFLYTHSSPKADARDLETQ